MGNLRACLAVAMLALAACGSDHAKPDASIMLIDSPTPDAKVWEDAPPGPDYDLSCFNDTPPATAPAMITISGTTQSQQGAVANVAVDVFKTGVTNPLASVTSDAMGDFTAMDLATGGMPIEGYVRAKAPAPAMQGDPTYRTTFMYPPSPVASNLTDVPVLLLDTATFGQLAQVAGGQNDTENGALFFAVTDCGTDRIPEATVKVQQGGMDVGNIFGLGIVSQQLAGTYAVLNVPDGDTQILVSYNGMDFPTRTVRAFKKPNGQNEEGTLTVTAVRPGP